MKINLCVDGNPVNGYTNVDPLGKPGTVAGDFRQLDSLCAEAEAREIRGESVLNHIHASQVFTVLSHYVSRLRHGGKLVIGGLDFYEICKSYILGQASLQEVNMLVHGHSPAAWVKFAGCYEPTEVVAMLEQLGLRVEKKRVNGKKFVVEAIRD